MIAEENSLRRLFTLSKILPAGIIITASSVIIYYLWKGLSKVRLSKWLEDYIEKINHMLKEDGKELTIETISYILHLNTEIADYFYTADCYEVESHRIQAYSDNKDGLYDLYMIESISSYDKCLKKANGLVRNRLKVQIAKLEERVRSEMSLQTIYKLKRYRKQYDNLPHIERNKLIECYLYYAEQRKRNFYLDQKEMNLMKKNRGYEQTCSINIFRNKYKLMDYLATNFDVHYKYLQQMVRQNDLLKIPKIKYFYDELNVLQEYV
jgi:hypothetical protein